MQLETLLETTLTFEAYYNAKRAEYWSLYNAFEHCADKLVRVICMMLADKVEFNLK